MRTFLVVVCSLALTCAAGAAQKEDKSKKSAPKKQQAQSVQHNAAPPNFVSKTYGRRRMTTTGGHSASAGTVQKTKGKTKGSQQMAAPASHAKSHQWTGRQDGRVQMIGGQAAGGAAGAGGQKTKGKGKASQQIATQGAQSGRYASSSAAYSKKTKQWKGSTVSTAKFQSGAAKTYKAHNFNLASNTRPTKYAAVTFQQNRRIQGSQYWQGNNYWAFRNYRSVWHDSSWWRSHYNRVVFVYGGWYYWNSSWWYPAWGYAPNAYYAYDGPIYAYNNLPPDQVVANVQAALQVQGYYQGDLDGLLGPLTRAAIANYQRDRGLYMTSAIDRPTLEALGMA